VFFALGSLVAQVEQLPQSGKAPTKSQPTPRDREAQQSSSKSTQIDISPPKDDAKNHPESASALADAADAGDVKEMHPYDPHKAIKNIEVGDYYFKQKNYKAAADRYQEALEFKPNDAEANFKIGQCMEKLGDPEEASLRYEEYLKILPQGPLAPLARKSL